MKNFLILSIVVLSFLFTSQESSAQKVKVGIVDVVTVVKALPEAGKIDKKLEAEGKKYQDTLLKMQATLQGKFEAYQKQKSMMPPAKQAEEEKTLQMQNQQMLAYRDKIFGQRGQMAIIRDQMLEPIRKKVKKAIESVAKEEKITIVLDKINPQLLYFEASYDITYKVIDRIKRGK